MSEQNKSLTLDGLTGRNLLSIFVSIAIIATCIYLTGHYTETHFPNGLGGESTLCNINNFFTCSHATKSVASNIMGVPVSFLGMLVGFFFLFGAIFPSKEFEATNSFISKVNLIGILFFFIYSLVELGALCPMCTLFYVLSGIQAFLFWKYGVPSFKPDIKILSILAVITLAGSGIVWNHYSEKRLKQEIMKDQIVNSFFSLDEYKEFKMESPYKILTSTENFNDAPIRVSVFSDFECPFCGVLAEQVEKFKEKYKGKMNIQYFFYPLDNKCNKNIKRKFHDYACDAAMVAGCDESKFLAVHDAIFKDQKNLSTSMLNEIQKENGLSGCIENSKAKDFITKAIEAAEIIKLQSTPTLLINGRKIEGSLPEDQFDSIFNAILSKANQ